MKADYKLKVAELGVARDSINLLQNQVKTQDTMLSQYGRVVELKDTVISLKNQVIVQKDGEIKDLKQNVTTLKKQRNGALIGGGTITAILIILAFVF
jgi:hypothetical protein